MAKNSVAIIGKNRLAQELVELGRTNGLDITLYLDANKISASTTMVVETRAGEEGEKKQILKKLDAVLPDSSVILTSSLGFSATRSASWISSPERVVGFATFYPLKERKVVELGAALTTEESSLKEAEAFFRALGRDTVRVKDGPGLIFARVLCLIINEAARTLDEGVARAEDIDAAMRLGTNYPSGPLRWADQIGLDEVLAVVEGLQQELGYDRYQPAPLIKKMVLSGWLGESSGRGFYNYKENKA